MPTQWTFHAVAYARINFHSALLNQTEDPPNASGVEIAYAMPTQFIEYFVQEIKLTALE